MASDALVRWEALRLAVNGIERFGAEGVRDPENPCEGFDARGYTGEGRCPSDGHYLCTECSQLSPDAPRFTQDRDGRADRLRLFFAHLKQRART